jgi:hypothetical protein
MLEPAANAGLPARQMITNAPVEKTLRLKEEIILMICPLLL